MEKGVTGDQVFDLILPQYETDYEASIVILLSTSFSYFLTIALFPSRSGFKVKPEDMLNYNKGLSLVLPIW